MLEFGAVIDDLANPKPLDELPRFHTYILNDKIVGEPYALAMHKTILERISKKEEPYKYLSPQGLPRAFIGFLESNDYKKNTKNQIEINVAGKNFAMFDKDWLEPLFQDRCLMNYSSDTRTYSVLTSLKFNHRVIDPSILFFKLGQDEGLPSSKECMKRGGLEGEVAHTAVEDALMVVKLLRNAFKVSCNSDLYIVGNGRDDKESGKIFAKTSNVNEAVDVAKKIINNHMADVLNIIHKGRLLREIFIDDKGMTVDRVFAECN